MFKAFSLSENILKSTGYFDKFKSIHYAHLTSNLVGRMRRINPALRKDFVEAIKKYNIDIDYNEFEKEDFYKFEKFDMNIIKYIKEHNFEDTENMMKKNKLWV